MTRSHLSSLKQALHERLIFSRRQANRRELERFFNEALDYIRAHKNAEGSVSDGIAAFSFRKFGALAPNVLHYWGIETPDELEKCLIQYLKACGSHGTRRTADFAESEALKALFRGDFWPRFSS